MQSETYCLRDRGEPSSSQTEKYCLRDRSESSKHAKNLTVQANKDNIRNAVLKTSKSSRSSSASSAAAASPSLHSVNETVKDCSNDNGDNNAEDDGDHDDDLEIQFKEQPIPHQRTGGCSASICAGDEELICSDVDSVDSGDVYSLANEQPEQSTGVLASLRSRLPTLSSEEKTVVKFDINFEVRSVQSAEPECDPVKSVAPSKCRDCDYLRLQWLCSDLKRADDLLSNQLRCPTCIGVRREDLGQLPPSPWNLKMMTSYAVP